MKNPGKNSAAFDFKRFYANIHTMDQEEKMLLMEIKATVSQNNEMLKRVVRFHQIALWTKILYWAFVVLLVLGAFTIIRPMVNTLKEFYGGGEGNDIVKIFSSPGAIEEFKKQLQ